MNEKGGDSQKWAVKVKSTCREWEGMTAWEDTNGPSSGMVREPGPGCY